MTNACLHPRRLSLSAKCSDMCSIRYPDGTKSEGYVPTALGIGGGDYLELEICVDCKVVVGFPDADAIEAAAASLSED